MDLEVREGESAKRQRCRTKLDCYRAELKRLTLEYIKARSIKQLSYDSAEELNDVRMASDQKQRLLDNSERIERTGRQLEEGYRVVIETQEIGNQVMQNLNNQRETIKRTRSRVFLMIFLCLSTNIIFFDDVFLKFVPGAPSIRYYYLF